MNEKDLEDLLRAMPLKKPTALPDTLRVESPTILALLRVFSLLSEIRLSLRAAAVLLTVAGFVLGVGVFVLSRQAPTSPAGGTGAASARSETSPVPAGREVTFLRWPPLSIRVARAPVIARCTMVELTETQSVYKVSRVIYGRLAAEKPLAVELFPAKDCRLMLRSELGREPTEAEVKAEQARLANFEAGGERILFLDQVRTRDNKVVWLDLGGFGGYPADKPLDARENEIVEILRSGAHLRLPRLSPEDVSDYVHASDRVVRARLAKVGSASTTWEVETVLSVGPIPWVPATEALLKERKEAARLTGTAIELDAWRLRAEAVANYEANRDRNKPATEDEIRKEFDRMVRVELSVGKEAILFLKTNGAEESTLTYRLVGMLPDEPEKTHGIDDLEKTIRDMLERGVQQTTYL